jgi:exopolyphosphatase/guanosine-5'-triphosphate,3'-diphosphate pyrophosphatase
MVKRGARGGSRIAAATRAGVFAVADIGSNSIHLLVAVSDGVRQETILDESLPSELGRLVERHGEIGSRAAREVGAVIRGFADRAQRLGAMQLSVVATEPLRRASDRKEALRAIADASGQTPSVLSHEEEGLLTVLGLLHGHDHSRRLIVADIGGGSTEVVLLHPDQDPRTFGVSIGSARLLARIDYADPPRPRDWHELRRAAQVALVDIPRQPRGRLVLVGGIATRLLKLVPSTMLTREILREDLAAMGEQLARNPAKEIAEQHGISPRRARLLPAGIAIIEALLHQTGADELVVDHGGIREGLIIASARRGSSWRGQLTELVGESRLAGA